MFTLDDVVPWGRSFDEYTQMFALDGVQPGCRILGCGDGPAGFNAEGTARGLRITSCDPIYRFDATQLKRRIDETAQVVLEQTRRNADEFVWSSIRSVDELAAVRARAMDRFLDDFAVGRRAGRYVDGALPDLPFADGAFDLALSSHFLFLYSDQRDLDFHLRSIDELLRVADEVRIFPLLALGGARSPHVGPVQAYLTGKGLSASVELVAYEFQRGGNQMMRIGRRDRPAANVR
jgi:hypothetical protein